MKYIFVTRLFSGIQGSIETKKWEPKGMPAYYKLIEGLKKRKIDADIYFLCKTEKEGKNFHKITKVKFNEIDMEFNVIPYYGKRIKPLKLGIILNDLIQYMIIFSRLKKQKYNIAYLDKVNIVMGLIATFINVPTVIRFYGVTYFRHFMENKKYIIKSPLVWLSLKGKYRKIICTEDGGPSKYFFEKYINSRTDYNVLLNGVDRSGKTKNSNFDLRKKYRLENNRPVILFVGRLTRDKGAKEFLYTLHKLKKEGKKFYAIMVTGGRGSNEKGWYDGNQLTEYVSTHAMGKYVKMEEFITHDLLLEYYKQCDVYVSLNKYGNLSNTVLEAMNEGKCVIALGQCRETHTDESTEKMVSENVLVRINRENMEEDLKLKLGELIDRPDLISHYADCMSSFSKNFLWSWDERIKYELEVLEKIAKEDESLI